MCGTLPHSCAFPEDQNKIWFLLRVDGLFSSVALEQSDTSLLTRAREWLSVRLLGADLDPLI